MNHKKKFNHLSRTSAHRKALLSNMAASLILHKRISTTVPKAKALKMYVEPLITKSKNDNLNSRRVVFSYLKQKEAVTELFKEIAPKIVNRPGGYTRILRTGNRIGDNAETCIIELVDYNTTYTEVKQEVNVAALPVQRKLLQPQRLPLRQKRLRRQRQPKKLQKQNNHLVSNSSPHRGGARRAEELACSLVLHHEKKSRAGRKPSCTRFFLCFPSITYFGEMALTACGEVFGREDTGELLNESGVAERT